MTLATGERFLLEAAGRSCPYAAGTPGAFTLALAFRVRGGSGRFAQATGGGMIWGYALTSVLRGQPAPLHRTLLLRGVLTY
jgi:hypothetical protein